MGDENSKLSELQQQARTREKLTEEITRKFAPEDDGLKHALEAAKRAGLPEIQISRRI